MCQLKSTTYFKLATFLKNQCTLSNQLGATEICVDALFSKPHPTQGGGTGCMQDLEEAVGECPWQTLSSDMQKQLGCKKPTTMKVNITGN